MPKKCQDCGRTMRTDRHGDLCKPCASICDCGARKDFRAKQCISCGMRAKALEQWRGPQSKTIREGLRFGGLARRWHYKDLCWESFRNVKLDGRIYAHYWDGLRKRWIYRYQWFWNQEMGSIPDGMVVHHKNRDQSDDRLENLILMTRKDHCSLHSRMQPNNCPEWTCLTCGKAFRQYPREGNQPRKFCSRECHWTAQRHCMT